MRKLNDYAMNPGVAIILFTIGLAVVGMLLFVLNYAMSSFNENISKIPSSGRFSALDAFMSYLWVAVPIIAIILLIFTYITIKRGGYLE